MVCQERSTAPYPDGGGVGKANMSSFAGKGLLLSRFADRANDSAVAVTLKLWHSVRAQGPMAVKHV